MPDIKNEKENFISLFLGQSVKLKPVNAAGYLSYLYQRSVQIFEVFVVVA